MPSPAHYWRHPQHAGIVILSTLIVPSSACWRPPRYAGFIISTLSIGVTLSILAPSPAYCCCHSQHTDCSIVSRLVVPSSATADRCHPRYADDILSILAAFSLGALLIAPSSADSSLASDRRLRDDIRRQSSARGCRETLRLLPLATTAHRQGNGT